MGFIELAAASEGALQQAAAAAAGRTLILAPEPVHHVSSMAAVAAAQAEVGGAAHGDVAHGALEGQPLAHSALRPARLTAAVAAVQPELCRETHLSEPEPDPAGPLRETYRCLCEVLAGRP